MDIYRKRIIQDYEDSVGFLRNKDIFLYEKKNWLRRIRTTLGMTVQQLAKRAGLTPARIRVIEKSEESGTLKMETLERLAETLNCKLVYALVPKKEISALMKEQAQTKAQAIGSQTFQSMALEDQETNKENQQLITEDLVRRLLDNPEKEGLWD